MQITISEIAKITNGKVKGDEKFVIESIKSLTSADEKSISYLADAEKKDLIKNTKAGALILPDKIKKEEIPYSGNIIFSDDPHWAFVVLLRHLYLTPSKKRGQHPTAVIDPSAKLGKHTYIGSHCIIEKNAVIGDFTAVEAGSYIGENTKIGKNCFIYPKANILENCKIGDNCIIYSGVIIGSDGFGYIRRKEAHQKIPQIGKVIIEKNVEIGANTTIDRAALDDTIIGEGTKIDNLVQIAHNVKIGKNCIIVAQAGIAGSSEIGDNTIVSGQAGITDHIKIGKNAIIIAQSGVMGKVADGEIMFGSPARPYKQAMKIQAILKKLPEIYKLFKKLNR